ncbi:MAG: hypothetical protein U0269_20940 [Polyangiales bacterium]
MSGAKLRKQPTFSAMAAGSSAIVAAPKHYCLECRTALGAESQCDGGRTHRVVRIDEVPGRAALFDEVWGPSSLRRQARAAAKAGGAGVAADSCADLGGCDGCSGISDAGELGAIILGILAAALIAILLWWIVTKIIEYVRARRAQLKPKGALLVAPRPTGAARFGTVRAAAATLGPAAQSIELIQTRLAANAVMLRHASTEGLEIALDDGSIVRVPAGRIRLEGTRTVIEDPSVAKGVLDELVGPPLTDDDGYALVPFDVAQRVTLSVGDRVAVYGPIEFSMDVGSTPSDQYAFRAPSRVLIPVGTPSLARVER